MKWRAQTHKWFFAKANKKLDYLGKEKGKARRENKGNCRYGKESMDSQHLGRSRLIISPGRN